MGKNILISLFTVALELLEKKEKKKKDRSKAGSKSLNNSMFGSVHTVSLDITLNSKSFSNTNYNI